MIANEQAFKNQVRHEIKYLLAHNQHPPIHTDIDAIWVFSGPGTFYTPLENTDPKYTRWMDRYRILYGLNILKQVTAKRLQKKVPELTKDDFRNHAPLFIYNGTPPENKTIQDALSHELSFIPKERTRIIDMVSRPDGTSEPIENTQDQVQSFPKTLIGKEISKRIAIVSHAEHIARILRYFEEYKLFPESITIEIFSLSAGKAEEKYIEEEVDKIWQYFLKGDLSWKPIRVEE